MTTEHADVVAAIDAAGVETVVAIACVIFWLALVIFQLADLGAAVLDERASLNRGDRSRMPAQRFSDYFWALPLLAFLALGTVLGIDYSARLIFVMSEPARGIVLLLALAGLVLFVGIGVLIGVTRRDAGTYSSLGAQLRAVSGTRVAQAELESFRRQLAEIDEREREFGIGRSSTAWRRQLRSELDALVRHFAREPARGLQTFDAIRWRTSARYLWTASAWRLVPVLIALIPLVLVVISGGLTTVFGGIPLWIVLVFPPPLSYAIGLASAKASLAAKVARRAANDNQRAEVERLLLGLERSSRKGISGLGERVSRALQILREQQS